MTARATVRLTAATWALSAALGATTGSQEPPEPPPQPPSPTEEARKSAIVERIDEHRVRIGAIEINQQKGELTLPGFVTSATILEYLANTKNGMKAYESALELETSAVGFNLALILMGLDAERSVPSRFKFDPELPQGDPLEVWVEWKQPGATNRLRAEDLIYNEETQTTLTRGPWVYTGSVFLPDGEYFAELDGVLIGFMHTPESIIDSPLSLESGYGAFRLHPDLGLVPGTPVRVTVRRWPEASTE